MSGSYEGVIYQRTIEALGIGEARVLHRGQLTQVEHLCVEGNAKTLCGQSVARVVGVLDATRNCRACQEEFDRMAASELAVQTRKFFETPVTADDAKMIVKKPKRKAVAPPAFVQPMLPEEFLPSGSGRLLP